MRKVLIITISLICGFGNGSLNAQLKTKEISIFKNGTAFIQKAGKVSLLDNTFTWKDNLPLALYGTFWFTSKTGTIKGISSSQSEVTKTRDWTNYFELLKANVGKDVEITDSDGKVLKGPNYFKPNIKSILDK